MVAGVVDLGSREALVKAHLKANNGHPVILPQDGLFCAITFAQVTEARRLL